MAGMPMEPARPSQMTWEGDITPPVVSYASSGRRTPLMSSVHVSPTTNRSGSAVGQRRPRRTGLQYHYSHGGIQMPVPHVPSPGAGGVLSSAFQTVLVQLHDWSTNTAWFAAGYPRNLGFSTRVPQLQTKSSGGPGNSTMDARPIFPRVQRVKRYSVKPASYNTRSANG